MNKTPGEMGSAPNYAPETLYAYAQQLVERMQLLSAAPAGSQPLVESVVLESGDTQRVVLLEAEPGSPVSAARLSFTTSPNGELRCFGVDMELSRPRYHYWLSPDGMLSSIRVPRLVTTIGPDGVWSSPGHYHSSPLVQDSGSGPTWVRGAAAFGFLSAGAVAPYACADESAAIAQVWQIEHANAVKGAIALLGGVAVRHGLEPLDAFADAERIKRVDDALSVQSLDRRQRYSPF